MNNDILMEYCFIYLHNIVQARASGHPDIGPVQNSEQSESISELILGDVQEVLVQK